MAAPEVDVGAGSVRWQPGPLRGPFTVVVLAEDYRELQRAAGIEGSSWRLPLELRRRLEPGRRYHAYVVAECSGQIWRSALTSFERS